MVGCCSSNVKFDGLDATYKRILWVVIGINGVMFLVEMSTGFLAGSQALKADALDFLGDTVTYAITLLVIGKALVWRSRAALLKGVSLGLMGVWVLGSTAYQVLSSDIPQAQMMGSIGLLALVANLSSVLLLLKYRNGDANVRSVWLCSRNDAIGNLAVIIAASGVWATNSGYPDLIVAAGIASLFLWSSFQIVQQSLGELRNPEMDLPYSGGHSS